MMSRGFLFWLSSAFYFNIIIAMTIFRVEDKRGLGPYSSSYEVCEHMRYAHNDKDHPDVIDDFPYGSYTPQHVCGCPSEAAFSLWFNGWIQSLKNAGYLIVEYVVPDNKVIFGDSGKQVMFNPADATRKRIRISVVSSAEQ